MKKIILLILSALFLSGCSKSQLTAAQIGDSKKLQLEIVNTPQSIEQGLSGRDEIGADGMLFIFDQSKIPQFWMKEMKFDLDLVWIRELIVVEITENVTAPDLNTPLSQLTTYTPKQPVDMVLEVEVGKAKEWGLMVGDEVLIH
jgi:uncharacterized protein